MLREFPYLTTMQEDVSVGSLVAQKFCQICLDHIAIITRQLQSAAAFLMPPGMYQRSTQSSIFHQGLGLILSPGRNQLSNKSGEKWVENTSTIHVPRKSVTTNGHGTEQPSLSTSHCTTRKNRKKKQRNEQNSRVSVSPGSTLALLGIYDFPSHLREVFPRF